MSTASYESCPIRYKFMLTFRPMAAPSKVTRRLSVLALALVAWCAFAADETQPAPRFRARTTTGEQFNNESIKGKVVLFEFWTTWCQYCEAEAELVDDIAKEFSGKGLIVLAVDVLESDKKVKLYLADHPRSVSIVLTKDMNLAAIYNAQSYPIYVVIGRDGNIAGEKRGAGGERALRRLLKRAGIAAKEEAE
jgi:cytochrome c biogenesis protein CcmG, thiol:disulfide interchange protein DsbE